VGFLVVALLALDEGEEPGEGFVLAGEGDCSEDGGAEPMVGGGLVGGPEGGEGFGGAGFCDGDGGFGRCVVFWREELCGPGAGVAGSEEFGFVASQFGAETEEEHGCVGAYLLDGTGGVDADREFFVGEEGREMGEELRAVEAATLNESESAGSTQRAGGVGGASPDGFELDVAHAEKEEFVLLVFEGGEGLGDGVFSPALRVSFDWVAAEAVEGCGEIRDQGGEVEVGGQLCGFGDEKVVAMLQSFMKSGLGCFGGDASQGFEGCGLCFDVLRSAHSLVAWDVGVNGAGPGVDAAGEGLGVGEALVA
jgi:hypothetical protein